jgi:dephospho-CoA kinase
VDADAIGHRLIGKGGAAAGAVVKAFGPAILAPNGDVDRKALGRIVFSDPSERERLNAIVHPLLVDGLVRQVKAHRSAGAEVVVVDAALIFELGLEEAFDATIVVTSPPEAQLERLRARGLTEEEAMLRISAQLPSDEKVRRADFHVENPGTPDGLEREADRIFKMLPALPRKGSGPFHGKDQLP